MMVLDIAPTLGAFEGMNHKSVRRLSLILLRFAFSLALTPPRIDAGATPFVETFIRIGETYPPPTIPTSRTQLIS